jgi:hypothetical protein
MKTEQNNQEPQTPALQVGAVSSSFLVKIQILFRCSNKEFYGESEIIEWHLPLPTRGDLITLEDEQNSFKMKYITEEDENAIEGNSFSYKVKDYHSFEGQIVVNLMFGDWDF